jgi:hypothetical protein
MKEKLIKSYKENHTWCVHIEFIGSHPFDKMCRKSGNKCAFDDCYVINKAISELEATK